MSTNTLRNHLGINGLCIFLVGAMLLSPLIPQAEGLPKGTIEFKPQYRPTLQVQRSSGEITIDGDLSDAGWRGAQPATNFTEHSPGDEIAPQVRTEAFVTFDSDNLYLSAICYADPDKVRATFSERERIFSDDNIGFFFDTYGDASRAYILNITPHGNQYDALWSAGSGEDGNFDFVFESAGKITDSGYQVEVAVPFSSLRFPNKPVQEWKFDFYRHHKREVHYSMSWATYDQNESCWPCQWGSVSGIEGVKPGKGIELLPSFVSHQSGAVTDDDDPVNSFNNGDFFGDLSLGGKYSISSDVIVEATYNPDFSQIEADASQIDVNETFALDFDEVRPFFQEGADLFRSNFRAVYTRSINDPEFAAKLSAKFGRTSISALSAQDERTASFVPFEEGSGFIPSGKSFTNIFAVRRSFGQSSHLRTIVTDRRFDGGGSGSLVSFDGTLRLSKSVSVKGQYMYTHTEEPDETRLDAYLPDSTFDHGKYTSAFDGESFSGAGSLVNFNYQPRSGFIDVYAYQRSATFRAENGFQPRNADRWFNSFYGYIFRPKGSIFHRITPSVNIRRIWNVDGLPKDETYALRTELNLRQAQGWIWTQYIVNNERFRGNEYNDLWSYSLVAGATLSQAFGFNAEWSFGNQIARSDQAVGRETFLGFSLDFRPTDRLLVQPSVVHIESHDINTDHEFFRGYIARSRASYQFSRELSLRLVTEYNDFAKNWSVDPLLTYRINPFSTFFLGATYDYDRYADSNSAVESYMTRLSNRQFFMKVQYLLQA